MIHSPVPKLPDEPSAPFPDPAECEHPEGLVAWGGDLAPERLLNAYRSGIFPWYQEGGPILWWCPDPRAVLVPGDVHISRRLARTLRRGRYEVTWDQAFDRVIHACAKPREGDDPDAGDTWITPEMIEAFTGLHHLGHAHSLEIWMDGQLAGGIYGVAIGCMFFAESMYHHRRDASKIALVELDRHLKRKNYRLMDCQIWNPHLERMGVELIDREVFLRVVRKATG